MSSAITLDSYSESLQTICATKPALGYNVLEKWSRMGIGVTILSMSQVDDMDFAKPLKLGDGRFGTIEFGAFWTPGQEKRACFETMLHCISGFQSE